MFRIYHNILHFIHSPSKPSYALLMSCANMLSPLQSGIYLALTGQFFNIKDSYMHILICVVNDSICKALSPIRK